MKIYFCEVPWGLDICGDVSGVVQWPCKTVYNTMGKMKNQPKKKSMWNGKVNPKGV